MTGEVSHTVGAEGIAVRYGLEALRRDWRRCSVSSDFVGAASCEPRFAQRLVSGAVNELLELVYKVGEGGAASLRVSSAQEQASIMLELPLSAAARVALLQRLRELFGEDPQQVYLQQLGTDCEPEPLFGLLQLVVDFGASLQFQALADGIQLRLELDLAAGGGR